MPLIPLYVYIDEGGDFDFSPTGSKFYTLTATITHCPWELLAEITELKHSILIGNIHNHLSQEYLESCLCHKFHASKDKQVIRDEFFSMISKMKFIKAHSVIIRKNRTNPSIRNPAIFYATITGSLLDYIFKKYEYSKLCIFVDNMPINSQKEAFLKAVKGEIKSKQPNQEFCIYFPTSASNIYLQVSDYINWAIFRKWEKEDLRSYLIIEDKLGSKELDMFRRGDKEYYQHKK